MANTNFEPIWEEVKTIKGKMYGCASQSEWNGYREEYKALLNKAKMVFQMFSTEEKFKAFKERENEAILKIYTKVKEEWENNNSKPITPPDWIIKELPKPDCVNTNTSLCLYLQNVAQQLHNDSVNTDYQDKVNGYKIWYINKMYKDYIPILEDKHPNTSVEQIKTVLKDTWNRWCSNYPIDE